jgi:hypothetical protein
MAKSREQSVLRANSPLRSLLDVSGTEFLDHACAAIQRILPHVEEPTWKEIQWKSARAVWTSTKRTAIRVTISIRNKNDESARSIQAEIRRRPLEGVRKAALRTLDLRELDICRRIALRVSRVLRHEPSQRSKRDGASLRAIRDAFDEHIVAQHIEKFHESAEMPVTSLLDALHTLSEQSYENKALTFGCILEPEENGDEGSAYFPDQFLSSKKYKALSDGYRTAYDVSANGVIIDFVDLDRFERKSLSQKHYFPDWAEPIARASRGGRRGIALSRQGDILIFEEGTLRFTYRYGRWEYWNHAHLVHLLRDRARAQRVKQGTLGRVVAAIYRSALDVSFRRSGGLFIILRNRRNLRDIVRQGDAIGDVKRSEVDTEFDNVIREYNIQSLPRTVVAELASLDGAVVLDNSGRIRAYGAVLQPKKSGRIRGTEGSRTKAAIGASKYGLAVKISSDGDVTVYHKCTEFIKV